MPKPSESWLDKAIGMEYYITDCEGVGGRLRVNPEDFVVEEVLVNGLVAPTTATGKGVPNITPVPGPYTWVIVEKRNLDTLSLISILASRLRVGLGDLSYGGLKDTRAVTSQFISIKGVKPTDIPLGNLTDRIRIIASFPMDRPMGPWEIWGNEFTVTVRGSRVSQEALSCVLGQINERWLPAYYGYQRFGLRRPNSHIIGKYIVKGMFEEAVGELLFRRYGGEPEGVELARAYAERGDYSKALELFPRSTKYMPEVLVLRRLSTNPRDYVNALRALPLSLLKLYVEAYQSYIFNRVLSLRISRGLPVNRAVDGDLVMLLDERGLPTRHVVRVTSSIVDKVNELVSMGRASVVGHVVGFKTRLLEAPHDDLVKSILRDEGVEPRDFEVRHMPELATSGGYRWLSIKPQSVKVEVIDDATFRVSFRLPKGNYATVFLREFMKPRNPEEVF